jgi:hypothetical protein
MLAFENIEKIGKGEVVITVLLALLLGLVSVVAARFTNPLPLFILSMSMLALGVNLIVYLTKKFGLALIFLASIATVTWNVLDTGALGMDKVLVYLFAGIVFELIHLIVKFEVDLLPLDVLVATSVSCATLPLITAFILSVPIASKFPLALINLVLLSFAVGLGVSILFFFVWSRLDKKKMLKFRFYLRSLK